MCDRTKDGDCRVADNGFVLCHTELNGVKKGERHPERPFVYCGQSDDAQGFGTWKPEHLCEEKPKKHKREPKTQYFDYCFWDGTPTPAQRYRKDFADGRPKEVKWCRGGLQGRPQTDVAPYRWHEMAPRVANGELLFVAKGELKVQQLQAAGYPAVSILVTSETLIAKLRAFGASVVLTPDCDLKDLDGWYRELSNQLPEARTLMPPLKGMNWRNPPQNGGLGVEDWLQRSKPDAEAIINAIVDEPWQIDAEPGELRDEFLRDAASLRQRLDHGLAQIDELPDVAERSVALHTLRDHLNLSANAFTTLVHALSEAKAPKVSESFDDLMAEDDDEVPALSEDFLAAGLVLIAAEGHAGKSSAAYQLAEAVTLGTKFAGQFQCQKAPVLIVQKDESKKDAKVKWRRMGLKPAQGSLIIKWQFSPMMFPELRRWITDSGSKLVILDSLLTIAGGQISPKDAEFGLLIYRLNQLAGELGITIVCLHHVVKAGNDKKRVEITKDDIFGTAYVYNGAADAWGLWRSIEDGTGDTMFSLRCLKARSGLVDLGTTYEFIGNDEDRRMIFKGLADRTITLDEIKSARDKIRIYLERANGAKFTPQQLKDILNLGSVKYAARLCSELFDRRSTTGVERSALPSTGGRKAYGYFSSRSANHGKVPQIPSDRPQEQVNDRVEKSGIRNPPGEELDSFPTNFSTTFLPMEEASERKGSGGVRGDLTPEKLLTREESFNFLDDEEI